MNIFKKFYLKWNKFEIDQKFKDRISLAFIHQGIEYYMIDDIMNMPTLRGLHALDVYDEFAMRCTKDFLVEHCLAVEAILSNPKKLDLIKLATLTKNLQDRLQLLPLPDHIYRLASVVFFDKTESPYNYERKYAEEKINRWKKDPRSLGFFLSSPLRDLIPFAGLERVDLNTYSAVVEQVNAVHLETVLSASSRTSTKVGM